ncbi:MAG: isoleucine--tRNA ligase [Candidatus Kapaibacterium sp.]
MFDPLPENFTYPDLERGILKFWEENKIFDKSLENRKGNKYYTFYEGPPTVNGKPGIHHLMARTIKDTVCRYKTLQGHFVRRQAGWDTHGLPVEISVQKELGLKTRADVERYGIDKFNAHCKEFVYKNIDMDLGWAYLTERMGYWLNMDEAYITCTNNYIESIWWALKQYFEKGLIYKGFKVVPQSPTIETPLSSHELSLGYKDVRDPNCYIMPKILSSPIEKIVGANLLVWTTTPWTLFANVALAVGEDIDYVFVKNVRKPKGGEESTDHLVLAEARIEALDGEYEILDKFKGADLVGTEYEQILPYAKIDKEGYPNALRVHPGGFVSTEDGSGIVHLAPAFGEDDYEMSKKFNLPFLQPVTPNGHFTDDMGEFAGRAIKTFTYEDHVEEGADKDIIIKLKELGRIYRTANDYLHSYPHCWRTGNPLMYYARESWFIRSPEYKDEMIALNKTINWQPPEIGAGRFGHWLEEVKDWSLSRDRFWGTPLPIWVSEDGEDMFAVGSIEELSKGLYINEDGSRVPVPECGIEVDLHRPFVDNVVFEKDGKTYRRVHEVIDVWFDSGSMPFAQMHYPFENKELFEKQFPSDFIAEGIDQTRGWFYTLHNIATALFDKPAYKNIVVNELILDKHGVKMSKSKGNTIDPFEIMEQYGADAVRWYLFVNNPPWKATLFNPEDIARTIISDFFRSLTNTYAFFAMYGNIDGYTGQEARIPVDQRPEIDRWIISRSNSVIRDFTKLMDAYELTRAHREVQNFAINELSNWYIRRNRRRFWKGEKDSEKIAAYQTLREVLMTIISLMSSAAPFLSETLYQRLRLDGDPESIHLTDLPHAEDIYIDSALERKMARAHTIVSLARSLREKSQLRVRQPLRRILIPVNTPDERRDIQSMGEIIKEELNIKDIEFVTDETSGVVSRTAKPNFKVIGKKFGKMTQQVAGMIRELTNKQILEIEKSGEVKFDINGAEIGITPEDIEVVNEDIEGWLVANEDDVTVALDTQLDDELIAEGIAREFINRIQNLRKSSGFEVTDRITIEFSGPEKYTGAISKEREYIMSETLAESLETGESALAHEIEIDGDRLMVAIRKA